MGEEQVVFIDRRNTDCAKWDNLEAMFGEGDLQAMWVADMDFKAPQCVLQAQQAYVAMGALIGDPTVLFLESENSTTDMMNGDFRWDIAATPTPPLKSATVYVSYTDAGFSAYFSDAE